jgi:hypothetical protein
MATIINCGGGTMTNCPFPIGYGGFFQTDPNTIYSGTTWQQKKDVFILAAGDTYPAGSTGGEAEHALTVDEMPKHSHGTGANPSIVGSLTDGYTSVAVYADVLKGIQTAETGGSQPHNNMPPYYTMPFWIRTA